MPPAALAGALLLSALTCGAQETAWFLPIACSDRQSWQDIRLTAIGEFGVRRKKRKTAPAHLHTGVDLKRPDSTDYRSAPILAAAAGVVVSARDEGPYSQVIIEHRDGGQQVWTAYEHVAGIRVSPGDSVTPGTAIARFMTRKELNRHGWQFDHVHFEVLKQPPPSVQPTAAQPGCRYRTYNLACRTAADLNFYYHSPREFLAARWDGASGRAMAP
jgi:murein DD-endopeptidase MepM/ murein hydrolase activator NlpD